MNKKVGISQSANDYAANRLKIAGSKKQSVPKEEGNNSPLHMAGNPKPSKGEIHIKGGASYMEGMPADAAGK